MNANAVAWEEGTPPYPSPAPQGGRSRGEGTRRECALRLSVVIPAYNEAERLPAYLFAIREHFAEVQVAYEVIVVDDGSTDGLELLVAGLAGAWKELRLVRHEQNQGRGAAIRTGSRAARGGLIMYADADGATPIGEEAKLRAAMAAGADIAIGSRIVRQAGVCRLRAFHRGIIGKVFALLVRLLARVPVRDSQCGFKMWRREAAAALLPLCLDNHWLLDVEFLGVAHRLGYRIAEVPVAWSEKAGSKVRLVHDSWRMFWGLWRIGRALGSLDRGASRTAVCVGKEESFW